MSKEIVKEIIRKAKENESFMQAILENPRKALQDYTLSSKEMEFFEMADRKTIEGLKDSCFELV